MSHFFYKIKCFSRAFFISVFFLVVKYDASSQGIKKINFCIRSVTSESLTYTLFKSNQIIFSKRHLSPDSCFSIKIDSQGTYQFLIESNCCGIIIKSWKADTLQMNTNFNIELKEKVIELKELVVRLGSRMQQKGDTLIIKTSDIQTRPHADASALFDKIPGLESGIGGSVRILGKTVEEITIDGKKIFGGVPSITLNSIKSDMIEQMEFVEKKQANGQITSQLNLKLKSNRKNGDYGDLALGYGNGNNYYSGGHYNKIGSSSFTSAYLTANSVNEKGVDAKDIERIMFNSFRNTLNGSSSIIGLYDNPNQLNIQDIQYFNQTFLGVNKVVNGGGNYTFTGEKSDFDIFVIFNKHKENFQQRNSKKSFLDRSIFLQEEEKNHESDMDKISIGVNNKLQLNKRIILRISNQLDFNTEKKILFDTITSKINDNPLVYQINSKTNNRRNELKNNFQISIDRRGKKKGVISSVYFNIYNKLPNEDIDFSSIFFNDFNVNQHQFSLKKTEKFTRLQLQAVQSFPLSRSFLLEGKVSSIREYFNFTQQTSPLNSNAENSSNVLVEDYKQEIGLYLMYQQPKLTMITGLSYLSWLSKRYKDNADFFYKNNLIRIPLSKIEYRASPRFSIALYYHSSLVYPQFYNLNNIPDSSNVMNFFIGNLSLKPYFEENLGLSNKFVIGKGFNINFTLDYNRYKGYIIPEQRFTNDSYFIRNSFTSTDRPVESIKLNFFILKIGSSSKLTWAMFGSFNKLKTYVQINEMLTKLSTNLFFSTQSLKWSINNKFSFQTNWRTNIAKTQKSTIFYNTVDIKSEYELNKGWYLNTVFNTIIQANASGNKVFQPFLDIELSKYLLKNNSLCASIIVKNTFNLKNQAMITQTNNQQSILLNSYLPRVSLLKLTFYPESWK